MIAEELKQRIILKAGLTTVISCDCKRIADEINKHLNKRISVTTLKRVFGFAKTEHHFSKYTLAALNDYADQPSPVSISAQHPVLSFIVQQGSYLFELNDEIGLHPQRLVVDVLELLLRHDYECLPITENAKCIGIVYIKDLISFLTSNDEMYGTLYHKFNFTLKIAIDMLQQKTAEGLSIIFMLNDSKSYLKDQYINY